MAAWSERPAHAVQADLLGVPVIRPVVAETTALGARTPQAWPPGSGPARTTSPQLGRGQALGAADGLAKRDEYYKFWKRPSRGPSTGSTRIPARCDGGARPSDAPSGVDSIMGRTRSAADPDRNLARAGARSPGPRPSRPGRHWGGGQGNASTGAVDVMRRLASIAMDGSSSSARARKDRRRCSGERVGNGSPPEWTSPSTRRRHHAHGKALPDALAVIAVAERGAMFDPARACTWKLAVAGDVVTPSTSRRRSGTTSRHRGRAAKRPDDITVAILDRPRHADLVARVLARARGSSSCSMATSAGRSSPPTRARRSTCSSASAGRRRA